MGLTKDLETLLNVDCVRSVSFYPDGARLLLRTRDDGIPRSLDIGGYRGAVPVSITYHCNFQEGATSLPRKVSVRNLTAIAIEHGDKCASCSGLLEREARLGHL